MLPIGIAAATLIAYVLAPTAAGTTALSAAGSALSALSASWFFVGEGSPTRMAAFDAVPRIAAVLVGVAISAVTHNIVPLLVMQIVGPVLAFLAATTAILGSRWFRQVTPGHRAGRRLSTLFSAQVNAFLTEMTAGAYTLAPPIIVAAILPAAVPVYAALDRIQRFALLAATPATQILQSWVPRPTAPNSLKPRLISGLIATMAASTFVALTFLLLAPIAISILSSNTIVPPRWAFVLVGVNLALIIMSRYTGLVWLAALGRQRTLLISTAVGAVLGPVLLFFGTTFAGLAGALTALAIAESAVLAAQTAYLLGLGPQRYWAPAN